MPHGSEMLRNYFNCMKAVRLLFFIEDSKYALQNKSFDLEIRIKRERNLVRDHFEVGIYDVGGHKPLDKKTLVVPEAPSCTSGWRVYKSTRGYKGTLIAHELVSIQPMSSPQGHIFYENYMQNNNSDD